MSAMIERMKGAALLRVETYEEVEADTTATGQAAGVIAIRQALDFSTGKAILTAILGWIVVMIPAAMLSAAGFRAPVGG